jgi:lipopolysaccharide/colanic/teichoic acid biosynthesis glycosyltransferase
MKIAVTGATGFVGRGLVPLLARRAELLLVGRDPARIAALFPGVAACSYDEIATRATGYDLLIHLATINSDAVADETTFEKVNVDLLLETADAARRAGVTRFVNISSFHALDAGNQSIYARTKRAGAARLAQLEGIETLTVYLPIVHADGWRGRMAFMNRLPKLVQRPLAVLLGALKPTVEVTTLAAFLLDRAATHEDREVAISEGQERNPVYNFVRRAVDLAFALVVIVFFWWALLLIWVAVKLQSPGPGIFAQRRIGRNGAEFTCYKFRTMRLGTKQAATNEVSATAVTRLGHFLRRSKLDELPQVVNILRNEISLIGPRPCLPVQRELIEERRKRGVLRLKPGISGLSQVNGIDMSEPVRLARHDARYAAMQSLLLDLKIALATVLGKGGGDRVGG